MLSTKCLHQSILTRDTCNTSLWKCAVCSSSDDYTYRCPCACIILFLCLCCCEFYLNFPLSVVVSESVCRSDRLYEYFINLLMWPCVWGFSLLLRKKAQAQNINYLWPNELITFRIMAVIYKEWSIDLITVLIIVIQEKFLFFIMLGT